MTSFDLLFLAAFLASLIVLLAAAYASLRGRMPLAFSILRVWLACAAVYLGASVAVAFFRPQRIFAVGEPWCFDDWCLTVENAKRAGTLYDVALQISSRAKRVSQRAQGAWFYLRDENDRHYEPLPADVPLDIELGPGQSVAAKRTFRVPEQVRELGLVTGHGGPHCGIMSLVIIGQAGCLFHKQTMIRLPLE
jgi:hypothetical protein